MSFLDSSRRLASSSSPAENDEWTAFLASDLLPAALSGRDEALMSSQLAQSQLAIDPTLTLARPLGDSPAPRRARGSVPELELANYRAKAAAPSSVATSAAPLPSPSSSSAASATTRAARRSTRRRTQSLDQAAVATTAPPRGRPRKDSSTTPAREARYHHPQSPQSPTDSDPAGAPANRREQLARNREAATRCRAKRKAAIATLQASEASASRDRELLRQTASALQDEVLALRRLVLDHAGCGVDYIESYIAGAARAYVVARPELGGAGAGARPRSAGSLSTSAGAGVPPATGLLAGTDAEGGGELGSPLVKSEVLDDEELALFLAS